MPRNPATTAGEPRWRRLDAGERRTQILECARRAFTERPYAAVSMAEIASCAGVRRGLLHHYFGGKHELYLDVVRDLLARFGDIVDAAEGAGAEGGDAAGVRGEGETAGDGFERLVDTYVDRWLGLVEQQADAWFALIDAESANRDAEVVALVQRARAAMVEGIVTALGLADVTPELRVVLRGYAGLAEVVTRDWLKRGMIDRPRARTLLATTLVVMVRDVTPAVEAAGGPPGQPTRRSAPSQ
jgi:AcrR family transcriptional regulator